MNRLIVFIKESIHRQMMAKEMRHRIISCTFYKIQCNATIHITYIIYKIYHILLHTVQTSMRVTLPVVSLFYRSTTLYQFTANGRCQYTS